MPNNDMTFCYGPVKGCPHEKDCARFLENVKLPNGNFYVQDFLMQSIGLSECKFFVPKNNEQDNDRTKLTK